LPSNDIQQRRTTMSTTETSRTAEPSHRRIVVGIDGSEQSKSALRRAADLAEKYDASLEVIGAWHVPVSYGAGAVAMYWDPAADLEKCLTEAVDEVFGPHRPAGLSMQVQQGQAARVLLDHAQGAFMLVVGSRGHGGFAGLLLGSVSSSVAEHATCPVLVVHGD
jgi:nucleotide-binding universal stress UspA family protein